jgi:peptide/nickel transport system substrate-binding protein
MSGLRTGATRCLLSLAAAGALLLPSLAAGTAAAAHQPAPAPGKGGTLVLTQETEPDSLDNAHTILGPSYDVFSLIYDTLVVQDSPTKFSGEIASSWTVSKNGLVYTFHIRPGIKFSNGDPVTAADVAFTFNRILNPATKSPDTGVIGPIKVVTAPNPTTAIFTLNKPFAYELSDLAVPYAGIEDEAVVNKEGTSYGREPIGSGPFKLKSWISGESITLVPNPYYHSYAPYDSNKGEAYLSEIKFDFIADQETEIAAMQSGEVTLMESLPDQNYEQFKSNPSYHLDVYPAIADSIYLEFKLTPNRKSIVPPFNQLQVRQAAGYAINTQGMITAANYGLGVREYGILPQGTDAYDPALKSIAFQYDPKKAEQLLSAAGWKPGAGGVRYKDGKPLDASLWIFSNGSIPEDAQIIENNLDAVGFKVNIDSFELASFDAEFPKGKFQMDMDWFGWPNSTLLNVIASVPLGSASIPDPYLTKIEAEAETTANLAKRRQLYDEAQTYILKHAYVIPFYDPDTVSIWSSSVHGVVVTSAGMFDFTDSYVTGG